MRVDGNGFDPATGYAFASSRTGVLTIAHEDSPGKFMVVHAEDGTLGPHDDARRGDAQRLRARGDDDGRGERTRADHAQHDAGARSGNESVESKADLKVRLYVLTRPTRLTRLTRPYGRM